MNVGSGMRRWYITVVNPADNRVLFASNTKDREQLERVAAEARRLRPTAQIFIRPPAGAEVYEWP